MTGATIFSQSEVATMCRTAGFDRPTARIASAISMVEAPYSTGTKAYANFGLVGDQELVDAKWWYSYGGFQIRSLRTAKGTKSFRDQLELPDPDFNCWAAFQVWKERGGSFSPWSTFMSGQYKAYLQDLFPPPPGVHLVTAGETLTKIATLVGDGTTWQILARINGLHTPYTIYIGQALLLPWFDYEVVAGDNLTRIAATYGNGITAADIAAFNHLPNANAIRAGQVLRIPRAQL